LLDVDNDGATDTGVQIFKLIVSANLNGLSHLEQLDQASDTVSYLTDPVTGAITEGNLLVYAPDDQQGFPSGFGAADPRCRAGAGGDQRSHDRAGSDAHRERRGVGDLCFTGFTPLRLPRCRGPDRRQVARDQDWDERGDHLERGRRVALSSDRRLRPWRGQFGQLM
jgi:hypothetical protein